MSSTEINIGFGDAQRASSKVLKPPGGGSSDIFGTQSSQSQPVTRNVGNTQSRLFGSGEPHPATIKPDRMKSSIFDDVPANSPKSTARKFVSRNPITGEVIEIKSANGNEDNEETDDTVAEDGATNGTDTNDVDKDNNTETNCDAEKTDKDPVTGSGPEASRPVQTCIRIKNPPGGKSSGIF